MDNKVLYNESEAEKSFLTIINAAVSHELRNPLNSLVNQAMFMKKIIVEFKKLMATNIDRKNAVATKVLKKIESLFCGIDNCARKM